ncbi:hypothetical protein SOCE26_076740 [Sorangium cellulosum]|uniref:Uncharacterized protein n=1 Tax=Sorangium cellulosum TaxID=56 RepID=A0A2L0F3Z5_SORCE|nr:hypothetical protein [Sorangium cellulosum]AUX46169.1 hypothetical protein SOCE26_076740 [Sorangium cellulosum]
MAKPKSPKKSSTQSAPAGPAEEAPSPLILTAVEQDLLERSLKLLVNIQTAPFSAQARREGYTADEHREGWRLLRLASGEAKPLEHLFAEVANGGAVEGAERLRLLQDVDAFENTWFPRTRAVIRRVVPRARREAFEAAFFKNLEQQPLGPAVIVSVRTFLSRLDGLSQSNDADAKEVRKTLVKRGLTEEKLKEVRDMLGKLEVGGGPLPERKVSAAELAKAHKAQREGLDDLRDWFNDWATTFRQVFGVKAQLKLGLTTAKRSSTNKKEEVDDAGDEEELGDEEATDDEAELSEEDEELGDEEAEIGEDE